MSNASNGFEVFYPFAGGPGLSAFAQSAAIGGTYPYLAFAPTEPTGVFQVIQEYNGNWWFVTNAVLNTTSGAPVWQQNNTLNSTQSINFYMPCYAWVYLSTGVIQRFECPATGNPLTTVNWVQTFAIDASGNVTANGISAATETITGLLTAGSISTTTETVSGTLTGGTINATTLFGTNISSSNGIQAGYNGTIGAPIAYSGTGTPTFSAPSGSIFFSYSNGIFQNTSAGSTSGTTWTQMATSSGSTVTSVTGSSTITVSPNTGNAFVSLVQPIFSQNSGNAGGINPQWYNVIDYGAVGNGSTNDSTAINAAITAANGAGGGTVYVPYGASGVYLIQTTTLTMKPGVSFIAAPSVEFKGNASDNIFCFTFGSGGYNFRGEKFVLGRIYNFGTSAGGAVQFNDSTSYADVQTEEVYNCYMGFEFNEGGTGGVFDHIVKFTVLRDCIYPVYFNTSASGGAIQGCSVRGNIIINSGVATSGAIVFNSAYANPAASNVIDVDVVNGNLPPCYGIVFNGGGSFTGGNVIRCSNFGAYSSQRYLVALGGTTFSNQTFQLGIYEFLTTPANVTTGGVVIPAVGSTVSVTVNTTTFTNGFGYFLNDGTHSFYGLCTAGGGTLTGTIQNLGMQSGSVGNTLAGGAYVGTALGSTYQDFSGLSNGSTANLDNGNVLQAFGAISTSAAFVANTTPNTRSTFNSGYPIFASSFRVSMAVNSLSANATQGFYVYSPFVTGGAYRPKFTMQSNNGQPLIVSAAYDNSTTNANEIVINIQAFANSTSTTVFGRLDLAQ